MSHHICERTDMLHVVGNTNASIGKGFVIRSAALIYLALFGGSMAGIKDGRVGQMAEDGWAENRPRDKR